MANPSHLVAIDRIPLNGVPLNRSSADGTAVSKKVSKPGIPLQLQCDQWSRTLRMKERARVINISTPSY
jgi:hypothetical protein